MELGLAHGLCCQDSIRPALFTIGRLVSRHYAMLLGGAALAEAFLTVRSTSKGGSMCCCWQGSRILPASFSGNHSMAFSFCVEGYSMVELLIYTHDRRWWHDQPPISIDGHHHLHVFLPQRRNRGGSYGKQQLTIECTNRRRAAVHPSLLASSLVVPRDRVLWSELPFLPLADQEYRYRIHEKLDSKGQTLLISSLSYYSYSVCCGIFAVEWILSQARSWWRRLASTALRAATVGGLYQARYQLLDLRPPASTFGSRLGDDELLTSHHHLLLRFIVVGCYSLSLLLPSLRCDLGCCQGIGGGGQRAVGSPTSELYRMHQEIKERHPTTWPLLRRQP